MVACGTDGAVSPLRRPRPWQRPGRPATTTAGRVLDVLCGRSCATTTTRRCHSSPPISGRCSRRSRSGRVRDAADAVRRPGSRGGRGVRRQRDGVVRRQDVPDGSTPQRLQAATRVHREQDPKTDSPVFRIQLVREAGLEGGVRLPEGAGDDGEAVPAWRYGVVAGRRSARGSAIAALLSIGCVLLLAAGVLAVIGAAHAGAAQRLRVADPGGRGTGGALPGVVEPGRSRATSARRRAHGRHARTRSARGPSLSVAVVLVAVSVVLARRAR